MSDVPAEPEGDLDLLAASLRADATDMRAFLPALAVRLEEAFPQLCTVKRKRTGLFSSERVVDSIAVTLGDDVYRLGNAAGYIVAGRAHVVRGVSIKTEEMTIEEWITELTRALADVARQTESGRIALQSLLETT
jgi:hypothetical protein